MCGGGGGQMPLALALIPPVRPGTQSEQPERLPERLNSLLNCPKLRVTPPTQSLPSKFSLATVMAPNLKSASSSPRRTRFFFPLP